LTPLSGYADTQHPILAIGQETFSKVGGSSARTQKLHTFESCLVRQ